MSEKKKKEREEEHVDNNDANNKKKAKTIDPEIQQAGKQYLEEIVIDILDDTIKEVDVNEILKSFIELVALFDIDKSDVKRMLKPMILVFVKEDYYASGPLVERLKILKEYL